jgi:hypothetical protein
MSNFVAMKIKVEDPTHSKAIQEKLFEMGHKWACGQTSVLHTDAPCLYLDKFGIGYSYGNYGTYSFFNSDSAEEHFLVNGQFVTKKYWTQPATAFGGYSFKLGELSTCIGKLDARPAPLPLQPIAQWLTDRMKNVTEHISQALAEGCSPDNKLTRELHALSFLMREF